MRHGILQQGGRPALQPPQFGLGNMMLAVALLGALFTIMGLLGAAWSLALLLLLCLIVAHVLGNSLGIRLREESRQLAGACELSETGRSVGGPDATAQRGGRRLSERSGIDRTMATISIACALVGGLLGGSGLAAANWQTITLPGIVLASLSSAVLGGLAGFLLSSFFSIFRRALREALGKVDD